MVGMGMFNRKYILKRWHFPWPCGKFIDGWTLWLFPHPKYRWNTDDFFIITNLPLGFPATPTLTGKSLIFQSMKVPTLVDCCRGPLPVINGVLIPLIVTGAIIPLIGVITPVSHFIFGQNFGGQIEWLIWCAPRLVPLKPCAHQEMLL